MSGLMERILAVCMPPPTVDDKVLDVTKNEMKDEVLHQTYSDGTVGKITLADDKDQPQSFYVVTRTIEKDGQTQTSTLKKSKDGYKMKDTNIFNCFDVKIAEAAESGGKYKGTFSTTQIKGDEVMRYTRDHNEGAETWTKSKVTNFQKDDEKVEAVETKQIAADTYKSDGDLKKDLSLFTGMDIPE